MRTFGNTGTAVLTVSVLIAGSLVTSGTARAQRLGGGLVGGLISRGGGGGGFGIGGGLPGAGGLLGGGLTPGPAPFGGGWKRGGVFNNNNNTAGGSPYPSSYPGYGPPYIYPNQGYRQPTQPVPTPTPTPTSYSSGSGQPYLATDGKYYYPDGRPYTPAVTAAPIARPAPAPATAPAPRATAAPATAAAASPAPVTPEANVIPDLDGSVPVATNMVRTQVPAVAASVHDELAQELGRSLEGGLERLERSLGETLFSAGDEASFLAIYRRSFDENTSQYRLARKNIKYLDAAELRRGLEIDGITDAGAQVYPARLESSAAFQTFKQAILDGHSAAEVERATRGLLKTYEGLTRSREFEGLNLPSPDELRKVAAGLQQMFDVRQRLAEAKAPAAGRMITLDRRFRIVRVPGLPRENVQAVDPQICLIGKGTGPSAGDAIEIEDGDLTDLGVPLLHPGALPLDETPRPSASTASTGALVQNPKGSPAKLNYVVDGRSYELRPGESRAHAVTPKSRISFNRGGSRGNAEYQLSAQTYRFAIQEHGWELHKMSYAIVLDNSANGCEFRCEIDGRARSVAAHHTLSLTSSYPLAIRFDRGNGQGASSKLLGEPRSVTIGVAPGSVALDLFPGIPLDLAVRPTSFEAIATPAIPAPAQLPKLGRQPILPTVDDLE
jgi:hypothetical protein